MKKNEDYQYDAFISYRHNDLDKFVAENLHRLLETYKIPKNVVEKYGLEKNGISRVFRDQEELPLSSNLEDPIIKALENSNYLIVICSPRLKDSMWCKREIETFIKLHGRKNVLAVLVEGEPKDSFPEELLYEEIETVNEKGKKVKTRKCIEPLAADVRGENKKEILKKIKKELLRLLAPMFELNYDDLRQRHKEREMRRLMIISTSVAIGCILFTLYSLFMLMKIYNQQILLKQDKAVNLSDKAFDLLNEDERLEAIKTSYQALTKYHDVKMPYTANAEYALAESLNVYDIGISATSLYQLDTKANVNAMRVSPDKSLLLAYDQSGTITLFNINKKKKIVSFSDLSGMESTTKDFAFLDNDRFIYCDADSNLIIVSTKDGKILKKIKRDSTYSLNSKENGSYFAISTNNTIVVYDANSYKEVYTYTVDKGYSIFPNIYLASDSNTVLFGAYEGDLLDSSSPYIDLFIIDIKGESTKATTLSGNYLTDLVTRGEYAYTLSSQSDTKYNMVLSKINIKSGEILYKTDFKDEFGTMLTISEKSNTIAVASSFTAHMVNGDNGTVISNSSIGESVVGLLPVRNSDLFLLFTSTGKSHVLNPQTGDSVSFATMFNMNCEYRSVKVSDSGYLGLPLEDNRIIIYNYYDNKNKKELDKVYDLKESIDYSARKSLADKWKLPKKNLVSGMTYNDSKDKLFVSYTDGSVEIYNVKDKKLLKTIEHVNEDINYYFGKTKDGYHVIGCSSVGYILNKNYEIIAKVSNVRGVNKDKNLLYVMEREKYYSIPIYSLNDLLKQAKKAIN